MEHPEEVQLSLDVDEIKRLLDLTTRDRVKTLLSSELAKLHVESELLAKKREKANTAVHDGTVQKKCLAVKITNYAWDQSAKFLKFFITLDNAHLFPEENITCSFSSNSFELKVKNLEDKQFVLAINKLLYEVDPAKSYTKTKTNMIVVFLAKKDEGKTWSHITVTEQRVSESKKTVPKMDEAGDPSEGLMSIMKKLYQEGDDEMKRTIAKAWTDSQTKEPPA